MTIRVVLAALMRWTNGRGPSLGPAAGAAVIRPSHVALAVAAALLMGQPAFAQELNLKGAIDIHVHQDPDSVKRQNDADEVARQAKAAGMRGLVMKNHWESTASLAYMVRKMVPGLEVIGGIALNRSVGGINLEAVKRMAALRGSYGKVVWLPTFDAASPARRAAGTPSVEVSKDGKLLPEVLELIGFIGQNPQLTLATGHISPEEVLMVVREARARGVRVILTHPMPRWTLAQMQEAVRDGAYAEFVYHDTLAANARVSIKDFAEAMKQIGPDHCIMSTDLGDVPPNTNYPNEAPGFQRYIEAIHANGISIADIDKMTKANPAKALGLPPLN